MKSKIGFTSKTFASVVADGSHTLEDVVRWGAENGFGWIELRDSEADLPLGSCEQLAAAAVRSGMVLNYAWDGTNVLDPADKGLFERGIARAKVFGRGVLSRITIAGALIKGRTGSAGYTLDELEKLSAILPAYIRAGNDAGVGLVFENSHEPLHGDGRSFCGVQELLNRVPAMRLTFDPANALKESSVRARFSWGDMVDFYERNRGRIPYAHLKSIRDGEYLDELQVCEESQEECLRLIMEGCSNVCLELPQQDDWSRCAHVLTEARVLLERLGRR